MMFWIIFVLAAASVAQADLRRNLMEACTVDDDCPKDSQCTIRGCDGSICLCGTNLIPNFNYTKCVSIAEVNDECNGAQLCRPVSSRCDHVQGRCVCQNGYSASNSNNKVIYCKQKPLLSTSTSFSLLKENCDNNQQKCSPENHLECDKGVCVCTKGYKEASIEIINAYPFNVVQCVPVNFSIGVKIKEDQCFTPAAVTPTPSSKPTTASQPIPPTVSGQFSSPFVLKSDIPSLSTDFGQTLQSASLTGLTNLLPTRAFTSSYKTPRYTSRIPEPPSTTQIEDSISNPFPSTILPQSNVMESFSETNLETEQTVHHTHINSFYTQSISDLRTSSENYEPFSSGVLSSLSLFTAVSENVLTTYFPSTSEVVLSSTADHSSKPTSIPVGSSEVMSSSFNFETSGYVLKSSTWSIIASISDTTSVSSSLSTSHLKTTMLPTSYMTESAPKETSTFSEAPSSSEFAASTVLTKPNLTPFPTLFTQHTISTPMTISPTPSQTTIPSVVASSVETTESIVFSSVGTTESIVSSSVVTTESIVSSSVVTTESPTTTTRIPITITRTPQQTTINLRPTTTTTSIGDFCENNSTCPEHAICERRDTCGGIMKCYCKHGHVSSEKKNKCLAIQYLGWECTSNKQCLGPNAACVAGSCSCKDGYVASGDRTRCRREMSWFVTFPLLGDRCNGFLSSCYNNDEQECRNKKCACKAGYREMQDNERKLRHKDYQQCIKNDTISGTLKETTRCTDFTELSDPYDSEANRKIRVMQGAIIGGIIAFIVLVLTVVGVISYIRYKKRTGDMNNDSGSEISFERQSSGRYSFKIPRPFATYNSTPADNVSFHNRSFKEDETHRLREDELKSLNGTLAKFYFDEIDYKSHDDFSRLHEDGK